MNSVVADKRLDIPDVTAAPPRSRRKLALRIAMGLALVASLRQQGITETAVPVTSLLIFLLLSAVLGLVAASWPARRAARLDVLAAIAAE